MLDGGGLRTAIADTRRLVLVIPGRNVEHETKGRREGMGGGSQGTAEPNLWRQQREEEAGLDQESSERCQTITCGSVFLGRKA